MTWNWLEANKLEACCMCTECWAWAWTSLPNTLGRSRLNKQIKRTDLGPPNYGGKWVEKAFYWAQFPILISDEPRIDKREDARRQSQREEQTGSSRAGPEPHQEPSPPTTDVLRCCPGGLQTHPQTSGCHLPPSLPFPCGTVYYSCLVPTPFFCTLVKTGTHLFSSCVSSSRWLTVQLDASCRSQIWIWFSKL